MYRVAMRTARNERAVLECEAVDGAAAVDRAQDVIGGVLIDVARVVASGEASE